jgi:hypothetical protein
LISIFNGRSRSLGTGSQADIYLQVSVKLRKHLHKFKGAKFGVFMAIALHIDENGWAKPDVDLINRETGYNRTTIFQALNDLCKVTIGENRVLLRANTRGGSGRFENNQYLVFPSKDEIQRYEVEGAEPPGSKSDFPYTVKPRAVAPNAAPPNTEDTASLISKIQNNGKTRKAGTPTPQENAPARDEGSPGVVCGSEFSWDALEKYAENNTDRSGKRLGTGWVQQAFDTGRYDKAVGSWYTRRRRAEEKDARKREQAKTPQQLSELADAVVSYLDAHPEEKLKTVVMERTGLTEPGEIAQVTCLAGSILGARGKQK